MYKKLKAIVSFSHVIHHKTEDQERQGEKVVYIISTYICVF